MPLFQGLATSTPRIALACRPGTLGTSCGNKRSSCRQQPSRTSVILGAQLNPVRRTAVARVRKLRPDRFPSVDLAIGYYRNKVDWTPRDLAATCLSPIAWRDLAAALPVTIGDNTERRWYTRSCVLISLGLTRSQIIKYLTDRDSARYTVATASLVEKLTWLHDELGLSRAQLVKLVTVNTRLLDYSLARTLMPRAAFFRAYFRVDGPGLGRIVSKSPRLLWAHPEYDVNVKVKILIGLVGDAAAVAVMLKRQPCIIGLSELTIQDKVRQLVSELQLRPEQLSRILAKAPSLLTRDLSCLPLTVDMLSSHGFQVETQIGMFTRYPQILTLNASRLSTKVAYLLNRANFPLEQLVKNPVLLGLSLTNRIAPRCQALERQGREEVRAAWLLMTDDRFAEELVPMWHSIKGRYALQ